MNLVNFVASKTYQLLTVSSLSIERKRLILINISYNHLLVCPSVCPVHCGKTADRIWMRFGIVGQVGPMMRQVVWFGDRSTARSIFERGIWGAPL